jgi:hypothetical protein
MTLSNGSTSHPMTAKIGDTTGRAGGNYAQSITISVIPW